MILRLKDLSHHIRSPWKRPGVLAVSIRAYLRGAIAYMFENSPTVTETLDLKTHLRDALRAPAGSEAQSEDTYDFSLVLGGPLYQTVRRAHLSGDVLELLPRRRLLQVVL